MLSVEVGLRPTQLITFPLISGQDIVDPMTILPAISEADPGLQTDRVITIQEPTMAGNGDEWHGGWNPCQ